MTARPVRLLRSDEASTVYQVELAARVKQISRCLGRECDRQLRRHGATPFTFNAIIGAVGKVLADQITMMSIGGDFDEATRAAVIDSVKEALDHNTEHEFAAATASFAAFEGRGETRQ